MSRLRLVLLLLVLALTTIVFLPAQLVAMPLFPKLAARIPMIWQRVAARAIGLRVRVDGRPAGGTRLLILSNHVSWLDIVTLGSVLPVSFIAKNEVAGWPVVKWLARLQQTVFVDRTRRTATKASNSAIAARLSRGDTLVLFAEGTTGDGIAVLPFRSALLGAAREAAGGGAMTVQPVAVTYLGFQGLPIGRLRMSDIAWHGDMDLAPHFIHLAGIGAIDAVVAFGDPIAFGADADRKKIAATAEAEVRRMVRDIRAGGLKGIAYRRAPADGAILMTPENR